MSAYAPNPMPRWLDIAMAAILIAACACAMLWLAGCGTIPATIPAFPAEPAPASAASDFDRWAAAEVAAFQQSQGLSDPVTVELDHGAGTECGGFFRASACLIRVYARNADGLPASPERLRYVLRHELLHYSDACRGIPPPQGDHEEPFKARMAAIWPSASE